MDFLKCLVCNKSNVHIYYVADGVMKSKCHSCGISTTTNMNAKAEVKEEKAGPEVIYKEKK